MLQEHSLPADLFNWTIRIYYEDTDTSGFVSHTNYLKFFERARTEWLRRAGVYQHALLESHRTVFVVRSSSLEYHSPSKLDDEIKITVSIEKLKRVSVQFFQQAWCISKAGKELLTTARFQVACVDAITFKPTAIPDFVMHSIRS